MTKGKAIYPGTFDPITRGHLDIVQRASRVFDHLVVAVAEDTNKNPTFSVEERVQMAREDIADLKIEGCTIEVMEFSGLLVDFVKSQNARVIVRGLRAASDFEYEFQMAFMNHIISADVETMFLPANENGHFISSRFVKQTAKLGGKIDAFVSHKVAKKLVDHFSNS